MRFSIFSSALLLTSAAIAADVTYYESAPEPSVHVPSYVWTGGYIGLNAGYGGGKANHVSTYDPYWTDPNPAPPATDLPSITQFVAMPEPTTVRNSMTGSGFVGGAQAGYNWQAGSFVYGIETDIQLSGVEAVHSYYDGWEEYEAGSRIKWFGTTRARLGFLPTDRLLAYATAGGAYGSLELDPEGDRISKTRTGWTVGAGFEFALDEHWSLKSEYLYTDLGKIKLQSGPNTYESDFNFHTVRAGVNYRF